MKKNRGVISKKEKLSKKVMQIAKKCKSLDQLAQKLQSTSITPYYRNGKITGVWLGNRKFRLTTLGVGKEHIKQLTKEQERLEGLSKPKRDKNQDLQR